MADYDYAQVAREPRLAVAYAGWIGQKICWLSYSAIVRNHTDTWREAGAEVNRLLILFRETHKVAVVDWLSGADALTSLHRLYADGGWWAGREGMMERSCAEQAGGVDEAWEASRDYPDLNLFYPRLDLDETNACGTTRGPIGALERAVWYFAKKVNSVDLCRTAIALSSFFHRAVPPLSPSFVLDTLEDLASYGVTNLEAENEFRRSINLNVVREDRTTSIGWESPPPPPPDCVPALRSTNASSFNTVRELKEADKSLVLGCIFRHFGVLLPPDSGAGQLGDEDSLLGQKHSTEKWIRSLTPSGTSGESCDGSGDIKEHRQFGGVRPGPGVISPPNAEPSETENKTNWRDVQKGLLKLRDAGESYTSQNDLAKKMKCSPATINKVIHSGSSEGRSLEGWMARAKDGKHSPRAQSLNSAVVDNASQDREPDPSEACSDDEVDAEMARLIDQAETPEKRAKLNHLTAQQRCELVQTTREQQKDQHIQDRASKGNRLLGRKA